MRAAGLDDEEDVDMALVCWDKNRMGRMAFCRILWCVLWNDAVNIVCYQ